MGAEHDVGDWSSPVTVRDDSAPAAPPTSIGALLGLQVSIGNAAVARLLTRGPRRGPGAALLRQGSDPGAPDGAAQKVSWDPRHFYEGDGLIPVTDHVQARNNLQMITLTMQPLQSWGIPLAGTIIGRADAARNAMPESGDLTKAEVDSLGPLGDAAVMVYTSGTRQMTEAMERSLEQYKNPEGWDEVADEAAEMLHEAFTENEDLLGKAKDASEKVHIAEENLHHLVEWGELSLRKVQMLDAEGIMAAQYLDKAQSTFKTIMQESGEVLAWVVAVHGAVQAIAATADAIAAEHDSSMSTARKGTKGIEAGTATVSAILGAGALAGLESAAGLGLVWANLVIPETQACISALEHLDKLAATGARKSQAEWWAEAVKSGGGPPTIPKEYLGQNWFPGGQATLNYMWAVFRGDPPDQAPTEVTKFFYENRKKMNLEHGESDQLDTEWHLLKANEVKNLKEWVTANKVEVWGMLYGSLPHP
jgi:hypothetical protein